MQVMELTQKEDDLIPRVDIESVGMLLDGVRVLGHPTARQAIFNTFQLKIRTGQGRKDIAEAG